MTVFEIPLTPEPQSMQVSLAGSLYGILLRWCTAAECWVMDLSDSIGVPLVQGIPLVPGTDLLGQHAHLGVGGQLYVQSDVDKGVVPGFDTLGTTAHLYFVRP